MEELVQSTVANIVASEGTFQFNVQDVYAGDEYAVAISRNTAQAKGRVLDIMMALSFRIIADTIVEVWEAPDDIDAFVHFWRDA